MNSVETPASAAGQKPTFGHSPDWDRLFNWARANHVSGAVSKLLDVALVEAAPAAYRRQVVGSLLSVIARPSSQYLFSKWSTQSLHADELCRLGAALSLDDEILRQYEPCGYHQRVEQYLGKTLHPLYLAGICIARPPVLSISIKSEHITWHEVLVAWLLHAAHVSDDAGYRQELYLHRLSERLRIASDDEQEQWILLLAKLSLPLTECSVLSQFEYKLAYRAENIRRTSTLDRAAEALFNSIIKIARQQRAELTLRGAAFSLPERFFDSDELAPSADSFSPATDLILSEDLSEETFRFLPTKGEDGGGIELTVTKPTIPYQRLTGRSILLAATEDLHFLPWSWNNQTESERQSVSSLTTNLLQSELFSQQLLGAIMTVAEMTSRSLRRCLEIAVNDSSPKEWSWQSESGFLVRESRRRESGWESDEPDAFKWLRDATKTQRLTLSDLVINVLRTAYARAPGATCLGDLWAVAERVEPEVAFHKAVADRCARVKPGMLGRTLSTLLHTTTKDATFTKLATSHPKSALPGACAYGSWTTKQINQAFVTAGFATPEALTGAPDDDSAMGSLLAVVEDYLPAAFARGAKRVAQLRDALVGNSAPNEKDLIQFHNTYVGYVVVQLLAATGARPVIDPFESPLDFNFAWHFVYVDDKAQDDRPSGRLIPIPSSLSSYIQTTYRQHLVSLARCIKDDNSELAAAIDAVLAGDSNHPLPYFFFLKKKGGVLTWESVSEASLEKLELFDWPLPLNLFRHRLANHLRALGVDVEIIDGLLGHGEDGSETYGDESWRTWQADVTSASGAINRAFSVLDTPYLDGMPAEIASLPSTPHPDVSSRAELNGFGRTARSKRRKQWLREANAEAIFHRKQLIAGRRLEDLTREELTDIGRKLLLNSKGMPHRRGWIKYQRFIDALERHGQITNRRNRPSKYFLRNATSSPFNDFAPRVAHSFPVIRDLFRTAMMGTRPYSYQQAACYGAIALCAESQVTDQTLLMAILRSKDYRVTKANSLYYIECGSELHLTDADATVRRHRVSRNCAKWLTQAQKRSTKARTAAPAIPEHLALFSRTIEALIGEPVKDALQLVTHLAAITDQWNAMTLPGVVAGFLAGRNESWSLPLRFWVPLVCNRVPDFGKIERDDEVTSDEAEISLKKLVEPDAEKNVTAADAFFKAFRKEIRDYDATDTTAGGAATEPPPVLASRRDLQRALWRQIDEASGCISPTLLLIAKWVTSFVTRKHRGRYVALSSLLRYLTALSGPFTDVAYASDLRLLDQDAITELYGQVLSIGTQRRASYRHERLRAFHRWCEVQHEVERPDWAELPCSNTTVPADAGLILEEDYLSALSALWQDNDHEDRESLGPALLLLLCYRFGLRPQEAIGIRRDEWLDLGKEIQIIIQTNDIRRTKVPVSSRRVVPLLFALHPLERDLLKRWFGALEAVSGDRRNTPIFCDDAAQLLDLDALSATARVALKMATRNPEAILYHARHTAGTVVAMALADVSLPGAERLPAVSSPEQRRHIQTLLLGYPGVSRRSPWALARYLGHAGTERARASYVHCFGDWADALIWQHDEKERARKTLPDVFDVDQLPELERVPARATLPDQRYRYRPTAARVLQFLRMMGRGYSAGDAAERLSIPDKFCASWASYIDTVDRRIYLEGEDLPPVQQQSCRFLAHINEAGWQRLLSVATAHSGRELEKFIDDCRSKENEIHLIGLSMIGATRQWTLWTLDQLVVMRALLNFWSVPPALQRMVGPLEKIAGGEFERCALEQGFQIESMRAQTDKKALKIDAGMDLKKEGRELYNFKRRCAFLFRENSSHAIRNSFQFLLAGVVTMMLAKPVD